jgi:putative colanic acid biosynthesis UDP-glucose lipid carrier transferase
MQITANAQSSDGLAHSQFGVASAVEIFLDPMIIVGSLFSTAIAFDQPIAARHVMLTVIALSMTFPGSLRLTDLPGRMMRRAIIDWTLIALMLILFGYVTGYISYFSPSFVVAWILVTYIALLVSHEAIRRVLPKIIAQRYQHTAVIVGSNETGVALAQKFTDDVYQGVRFLGFFDERSAERSPDVANQRLLGSLNDLASYVKQHHIEHIYIALPMSSEPRILSLLDDIKDTTASIFFVPDIFMIDLIQGQVNSINGIPVVGVCESPFIGIRGVAKRVSDIALASLILLVISPLMVAVAIGVRMSSPGPIIFAQRRYGLDGREIIVYKFRSMTVTEDGDKRYAQVTRGDNRVTRFGAFIRKTSLDELPQFINVLQGRMSIVGPRPHAIAVNEQYRQLIRGYMVRHKVKPGITGWAQVNGYRGGDDLEHMKMRIKFDLEYLRNWSLRQDLFIILKTIALVIKDSRAF